MGLFAFRIMLIASMVVSTVWAANGLITWQQWYFFMLGLVLTAALDMAIPDSDDDGDSDDYF